MNAQDKCWTIGSILQWTKQYFSDKGVESPRLDAEVLLSHILGKDRLYLYVNFDQPLQSDELAAYREAVKKRVQRQPVAYIIGQKEFMGLDFIVSPAVLIPRPDTEILVEAILAKIQELPNLSILDLGTGSGAIIISLLAKVTSACGTAVDISREALKIAAVNAEKNSVYSRLTLLAGDLYGPVGDQVYDVIVSNPPYIPNADIAGLEQEVQREPAQALAGGHDGLDFYRRIVDSADKHLKSGGLLAFEVGINQAEAVADLGNKAGLMAEGIIKDYGGIDRVVLLRKHK